MNMKLYWRILKTYSFLAFVLIHLVLLLQSHAFAQQTKGTEIVAADATVKEIFSGGETQLEGPAMSPDGMLYFCDLPLTNGVPGKAGIIWRLNPLTGESSVFRSPSGMANRLTFDAEGNLIVCEGADFGGRRVTRTDMKTGKSVIIAGLYQGRPFNAPNDVAVDEQGRV
ncbi:SMP-30/gluconolactonase/LRE family protein [Pontibacter pamirensis]|uniref:SMP-30/gluconolactonase/LRE family protein n=1 Tax=Pontibacter pamirensis TaxID=2562824 RepID=UPI0013899CE2|nr:SMP-30/gluconolactonase/LRE family protein [Pontibacter pamirensis]